jgi:hypothetical protein
MSSLEDVGIYFEIFDDYLDFHIYPWDEKGYDEGVMYPERKAAIRYLTLAMNLYKQDPLMLPENLLDFMEEYQKPQYQKPEKVVAVQGKRRRRYSDLNKEVNESVSTSTTTANMTPNTGLSKKEMQGFDMSNRRGFAPSDVVMTEQSAIIGKSKAGYNIRRDMTTRSVFFDVPGEDSLHPETWDWKRYSSPEDIARYESEQKNKKGKKTKK